MVQIAAACPTVTHCRQRDDCTAPARKGRIANRGGGAPEALRASPPRPTRPLRAAHHAATLGTSTAPLRGCSHTSGALRPRSHGRAAPLYSCSQTSDTTRARSRVTAATENKRCARCARHTPLCHEQGLLRLHRVRSHSVMPRCLWQVRGGRPSRACTSRGPRASTPPDLCHCAQQPQPRKDSLWLPPALAHAHCAAVGAMADQCRA